MHEAVNRSNTANSIATVKGRTTLENIDTDPITKEGRVQVPRGKDLFIYFLFCILYLFKYGNRLTHKA